MTFLWKGPYEDGITQSLLSKFLVCRERFRLLTIEGIKEIEQFDAGMEYGTLFHLAIEAYYSKHPWRPILKDYTQTLHTTYPLDAEDIDKWYALCNIQFPLYLDYIARKELSIPVPRRNIFQELEFNILYPLPTGRQIRLRGKLDSVFTRGDSIKIEEHKTKSYIDEQRIAETLHFNFQTLFYHTALRTMIQQGTLIIPRKMHVIGTQYNVIRRPLSSKYPIRQKKSETLEQFYDREGSNIKAKPQEYFSTMNATITTDTVHTFQQQCLNPLLETLCDWWDYMLQCNGQPFGPDMDYVSPEYHDPVHYRTPWGIFNSMFGGFEGPYYDYLSKGHHGSIVTINSLFRELEP